jgi:hypothetical protein
MYEIGDILLLKPEVRRNTEVIVTGLNLTRPKNKYSLRINKPHSTATYCGSEGIIASKIGQVEPNHPFLVEAEKKAKEKAEPKPQLSRFELLEIDKYIRTLEEGDVVFIKWNGKVEKHFYVRYLPKGRKCKFLAKDPRGKIFKWKLEDVQVPT